MTLDLRVNVLNERDDAGVILGSTIQWVVSVEGIEKLFAYPGMSLEINIDGIPHFLSRATIEAQYEQFGRAFVALDATQHSGNLLSIFYSVIEQDELIYQSETWELQNWQQVGILRLPVDLALFGRDFWTYHSNDLNQYPNITVDGWGNTFPHEFYSPRNNNLTVPGVEPQHFNAIDIGPLEPNSQREIEVLAPCNCKVFRIGSGPGNPQCGGQTEYAVFFDIGIETLEGDPIVAQTGHMSIVYPEAHDGLKVSKGQPLGIFRRRKGCGPEVHFAVLAWHSGDRWEPNDPKWKNIDIIQLIEPSQRSLANPAVYRDTYLP